MKKPTVVSLFAGAGGMDLGFKQAGFDIVWANDFDKDCVITYRKNLGNHIVLGDIKDVKSEDIPNNPDVVIGGFPCQDSLLIIKEVWKMREIISIKKCFALLKINNQSTLLLKM